ncbi:hypothetical protein SAY86_003288 [Trapa natans]|uniref:Uncharacterized protein n=1 Tax=Trapa natans TaxID=22666 RepID=A0AAN7MGW8_TRANT|nr:hypothetical protein SAY86_003288 [Trapa natans]
MGAPPPCRGHRMEEFIFSSCSSTHSHGTGLQGFAVLVEAGHIPRPFCTLKIISTRPGKALVVQPVWKMISTKFRDGFPSSSSVKAGKIVLWWLPRPSRWVMLTLIAGEGCFGG